MPYSKYILIGPYNVLNDGRNFINQTYSGLTVSWSGSFGTYSMIKNNIQGNLGNFAQGFSSMAAGMSNRASGNHSIAFWGTGNTATTIFSAVLTGKDNKSASQAAVVLGGYGNAISASSPYATILNGVNNIIDTASKYSTIINGKSNLVKGNYSFVNGFSNTAWTQSNTILGGKYNSISGNTAGSLPAYWAENAIIGGGGIGDYAYNRQGKNLIRGAAKSTILGGIGGFIYDSTSCSIQSSGLYSTSFYSPVNLTAVISGNSSNSSIIASRSVALKSTSSGAIIGSVNSSILGGSGNFLIGATSAYVGASSSTSSRSGIIGSSISNVLKSNYSIILGSSSCEISGNTGIPSVNNAIISTTSSTIKTSNSVIGRIQKSAILGGSGSNILSTGFSSNNVIIGGYTNSINKYVNSGTFGGNSIIGGNTNLIHNRTGAATTRNNFIAGGNLNAIVSTAASSYINNAIIGGLSNTAITSNSAILAGKGNSVIHAYSVAMGGGAQTRGTFSFVLGNQNTTTPNPANNTVRLDTVGGTADGVWATGAADYAEYFEWLDKNKDNENRLGYFVSLVDDKIEIGNSNLIGIISSVPGFLGDAPELKWSDIYLKDDWGRKIQINYKKYQWHTVRTISNDENEKEEIINHFIAFEDEKGNKFLEIPNPSFVDGLPFKGIIPADAKMELIQSPKINPNYKPDGDYIPRSERPEWAPVGLLGKLRVRTAEPIIGKTIDVNSKGLAINGNKYRILSTVRPHSDSQYGIVKIFFK